MAIIKTNKAIKLRIHPTEKQIVLIEKTFGCCRYIWNKMLGDEIDFYHATDMHFIPTPAKYKKSAPWLKEVDSLALANTQLDLKGAFTAFFENRSKHPKFKSKKHSPVNSYTTNCQYPKPATEKSKGNLLKQPTIRLIHNAIHLPTLGDVKATIHRTPQKGWKLKSATISKSPTGKYYCSLLYEITAEEPEEITPVYDSSIGMDYSSPSFYVDDQGNEADAPKAFRRLQDRLAKEQRKLSHMTKGSKNYFEQLRRINLIHEKIKNQRLDFAHKESRRIANAYSAACFETIDLRAMSRTLNLGKATMDNGFGLFRILLKYKMADQGKQVLFVGKWFPSSKTCSVCGFVNKDLKLDDREWVCPNCGVLLRRDPNAAINIKAEAIANYFDIAQSLA